MTIQDMTANCTRIAVVGTRGYDNYVHFSAWVKHYTQNSEKICFISGGAKSGADNMIERYADENDNNLIVHYPLYNEWGKQAPLIRNHKIVDDSNIMIAFWDGKSTGTAHAMKLAREKGIQIYIVDVIINNPGGETQ